MMRTRPTTLPGIGPRGKTGRCRGELPPRAPARPEHALALNQLGGMLVLQGRAAEAVEPLRRALALDPTSAILHFQVSLALLVAGTNPAEAAGHLRQAVRLKPDWAAPCNALAWLLATSPDAAVRDTGEALRYAGRAVELSGGADSAVLDTRAAGRSGGGTLHGGGDHSEARARSGAAVRRRFAGGRHCRASPSLRARDGLRRARGFGSRSR